MQARKKLGRSVATCLKLAIGTGTFLDQVPASNLTVSFFLRQARGV